jgi:hypothetical protein
MKLTVQERLVATGLLPGQGDILFLRLRDSMIDKIGLSSEEIEKYGVRQEGEQIKWDENAETDIPLEDLEISILRDALTKMNKEKKLFPAHKSLYVKIVEKGE